VRYDDAVQVYVRMCVVIATYIYLLHTIRVLTTTGLLRFAARSPKVRTTSPPMATNKQSRRGGNE
jgi:hypothetical protein